MSKWTSFCNPGKEMGLRDICVFAFHLIFILVMLFGPRESSQKKHKHHLIVKTLLPPSPVVVATSKSSFSTPSKASHPPTQKPASKPKESGTKKNTASSKVSPQKKPDRKKETSPSSQPAPRSVQEQQPTIPKELLEQLETNIAKIEAQKKKMHSLTSATTLSPLQIDTVDTLGEESGDEVDLIVTYLHKMLELPEQGAVKIELTLRQDGSVAKLIVLQAQSKRNKAYLEEQLLRLHFPHSRDSKERTLTLNFCNIR